MRISDGVQTCALPISADKIVQRTAADELTQSLGILGLNGVTAYLALTLVGQPQAGETVLVSTAAGAVGSAVGQIAKIYGCRTVGIAGGSEKAQRCIQEFGRSEERRGGKEGVRTCRVGWCAVT